jgi:hypothetical protein
VSEWVLAGCLLITLTALVMALVVLARITGRLLDALVDARAEAAKQERIRTFNRFPPPPPHPFDDEDLVARAAELMGDEPPRRESESIIGLNVD